jgi:hypothetical protein
MTCDCLTWHHPLWALVARRAGVKPGVVWSIYSSLLEQDPVLARLSPKDQVQTLSLGLGWKPAEVALVMASLQHSGVIDDRLRLAEAWRPVVRPVTVTGDVGDAVTVTGDRGDVSVTSGDASVTLPLERRRAVSRRSSAKYRAKLRGDLPDSIGYPQEYPPTLGDATKEEKEEADPLLSQEQARVRETQPIEFIRKERWATGVMRRADEARMLSKDEAARLWSGIMLMRPDRSMKNWGLPRRTNDELDRLDNLVADREAPKLPLGGRQLIGVEGGRGPPVTGVTEEERLRRYHRRMMG